MISRRQRLRLMDKGFAIGALVSTLLLAALLASIVVILWRSAGDSMAEYGINFLFTKEWNAAEGREQFGILAAATGTLVTTLIGLLISVPLGVGTAVFLNERILPRRLAGAIIFMVEQLATIPSVVIGLWGIFILIPLLRTAGLWLYTNFGWFPLFSTPPAGPGILPAGVILGIMTLPLITSIARDSLAAVPPELRAAAYGLGATRWETVWQVMIPAAFSGIVGGIMLALGRALGETMAVTMVVGNSMALKWSILGPGNTISSLIANEFAEAADLQLSSLMYAALWLLIITLVVNVIAEIIINRVKTV